MAVSIPLSHARVLVRLNTFISRVPKKALGAALGAVIAGLVFIDSQAQALVVTVNGQNWDVTTFTGMYKDFPAVFDYTTFTGTYSDNTAKFETAANGGVMPWWGSSTDTAAFATAVAGGMGHPNSLGSSAVGPFFAFRVESYDSLWAPSPSHVGALGIARSDGQIHTYDIGLLAHGVETTWAQATLVPAAGSASVPGPLPILGLAAAFGFSRKLRKRIKLHTAQQTRS
jgi:hypothetical protein